MAKYAKRRAGLSLLTGMIALIGVLMITMVASPRQSAQAFLGQHAVGGTAFVNGAAAVGSEITVAPVRGSCTVGTGTVAAAGVYNLTIACGGFTEPDTVTAFWLIDDVPTGQTICVTSGSSTQNLVLKIGAGGPSASPSTACSPIIGNVTTAATIGDVPSTGDCPGPASGPIAGGNVICVAGAGFGPGSNTTESQVTIGGVAVAQAAITVSSKGDRITFTAPAHAAGVVDITVTNRFIAAGIPQGQTPPAETVTKANAYTYLAGPQPGEFQFSAASFGPAIEGGSAVQVNVSRVNGTSGAASVQCVAVGAGGAIAADFTFTPVTANFADGAAGPVSCGSVLASADAFSPETGESVTLSMVSATGGATVSSTNNSATVLLTNVAGPPVHGTATISASASSATEGGPAVTVSITRSGASNETAGVSIGCLLSFPGGLATAADISSTLSSAVSFAANENTTKSCGTVAAVLDNSTPEAGESVLVTADPGASGVTAVNPSTVTITLVNVAPAPGAISFAPGTITALAGGVEQTPAQTITVFLQRTGGSAGAMSVICTAASGTATLVTDFAFGPVTANWSDGDATNKSCGVVTVIDDILVEGSESATITLSDVGGDARAIGSPSTATLTIAPSDQPTPVPTSTPSGGVGAVPGAFTPTPTNTAVPTATPTSTPRPPTNTPAPATATSAPATAVATATATRVAPAPPNTGSGTTGNEVSWFMILGAVMLMVAGTAIVARRTSR